MTRVAEGPVELSYLSRSHHLIALLEVRMAQTWLPAKPFLANNSPTLRFLVPSYLHKIELDGSRVGCVRYENGEIDRSQENEERGENG